MAIFKPSIDDQVFNLTRDLKRVRSYLTKITGAQTRLPLNYKASVSSYGTSPYLDACYEVGPDGWVTLAGMLKVTAAFAANAPLFTCGSPALIPAGREVLTTQASPGPVRMDVDEAGNFFLTTALASGQWVSVSGIRFRTT